MKLGWIVLSAIALDLFLGDPRWFPHPVRWIGKMARGCEVFFRKEIRTPFWSGFWTAMTVYSASFFFPFILLRISYKIFPWLGDLVSVFILYTTIAIRDLLEHSMAVYRALKASNLQEARVKVGMIVGRDTGNLTQKEVVRACVESVAESMVDGVTAPLFFAVFGGPAWAMLYRSLNTLDSLFGYQDERYRFFGKMSAKMDDAANYIPARITSFFISLSSFFLFLRPANSFFTLFRDGKKHPSPNSGLPEAAVAGALGVQLGGENFYGGIRSKKPYLGEKKEELQSRHILKANQLLLVTALLTVCFYFFVFQGLQRCFFNK